MVDHVSLVLGFYRHFADVSLGMIGFEHWGSLYNTGGNSTITGYAGDGHSVMGARIGDPSG